MEVDKITKQKVLTILKNNQGNPVSGEEIADNLKISRAAVWKNIDQLRKLGYQIDAKTNVGYVLISGGGFHKAEIQSRLESKNIGKNLVFLDEVSSTNNYAKEIAREGAKEGTVVISNYQKNGKGRMKREFYSPSNDGIYLSVILRPNLTFEKMNLFTLCVAMAVTNAIELVSGSRPKIKWPNDIMFSDKKVCGILSECMISSEFGNIEYLICGIGINVNNKSFKSDIPATSIFLETSKIVDRVSLINEVFIQIEKFYYDYNLIKDPEVIIKEYKKDMIMLNQQVTFIENNIVKSGIAKDIDENGRLIILYPDGSQKTILSCEIKQLRRQNYNE